MMRLRLPLMALVVLSGCKDQGSGPPGKGGPNPGGQPGKAVSLPEARQGFQTTVPRKNPPGQPIPQPPQKVFELIRYDAPPGKLGAYLTPDPRDGKKHPAVIWIHGGDCNVLG